MVSPLRVIHHTVNHDKNSLPTLTGRPWDPAPRIFLEKFFRCDMHKTAYPDPPCRGPSLGARHYLRGQVKARQHEGYSALVTVKGVRFTLHVCLVVLHYTLLHDLHYSLMFKSLFPCLPPGQAGYTDMPIHYYGVPAKARGDLSWLTRGSRYERNGVRFFEIVKMKVQPAAGFSRVNARRSQVRAAPQRLKGTTTMQQQTTEQRQADIAEASAAYSATIQRLKDLLESHAYFQETCAVAVFKGMVAQ